MPNDFIGIDLIGLEEVKQLLDQLPELAMDMGTDEANKYMLNVMKRYAPYKHIRFKDAYGDWFSEKQRRFVMAAIKEGRIKPGRPNRNQNLSKGWYILGEGRNSILVNEVPYAPYVQGSFRDQARMMSMIGWDPLEQVLRDRTPEIVKKFMAGVKKAIRSLRRK